jgi:transcription elongation factor Elf1
MKNNYCEEQTHSQKIKSFHEKEAERNNIPAWANVNCPHCNSELDKSSIRSVGGKFNARNMGDIIVEVLCGKCGIMDTVYFRKQFSDIKGYIELLDGTREPDCEAVCEESMYKLQYNNLFEKMIKDEQS